MADLLTYQLGKKGDESHLDELERMLRAQAPERAAKLAAPAPRAAMPCPLEDYEQGCLFAWAAAMAPRLNELDDFFAVPNGGMRPSKVNKKGERFSVEGKKLKAQGAKRGVPDLMLPVARHGFNGLFIEMKRVNLGTVSSDQKKWHAKLRARNYRVEVAWGGEEAVRVLLHHLGVPAQSPLANEAWSTWASIYQPTTHLLQRAQRRAKSKKEKDPA